MAVAQERDAATQLPINVVVEAEVRPEVEKAAALSATLRRQLDAFRNAHVRINVRVTPAATTALGRAETTIGKTPAGFLHAWVLVPPGVDFVELLAHELEHVLEQIEGIDLAELGRRGGAWRIATGVYETARAQQAGVTAAREVEDAPHAGH
jgi:hypothetical protein